MCIHNPRKILTPRSGVRWHILSTLSKTFVMPILMIIFEASSRWQKKCMNKNLLHQQSTAKTGPRLLNCTLCHDWSMENGASMIRVDSNCRTYSTLYTVWYNTLHRFLDGRTPQIRISHSAGRSSSWYVPREMKQIHPWSSKFIRTYWGHQLHTIQVTQSKHIITRQKHGIVKAEYYVGWHWGVYTLLHTDLNQAFIKPPVTLSSTIVC